MNAWNIACITKWCSLDINLCLLKGPALWLIFNKMTSFFHSSYFMILRVYCIVDPSLSRVPFCAAACQLLLVARIQVAWVAGSLLLKLPTCLVLPGSVTWTLLDKSKYCVIIIFSFILCSSIIYKILFADNTAVIADLEDIHNTICVHF